MKPLVSTARAAQIALFIEFVLWMGCAKFIIEPNSEWLSLLFVAVIWALVLRFWLATLGMVVSRILGIPVNADEELAVLGTLQFLCLEWFHLCMQNILQIPFRQFFKTSAERGVNKGRGGVVLMQHGYMNNGGVWFFTARALEAKGYRVFTLDQPMFESIDLMGDRLHGRIEEVLASTGESKLVLVSHSMGGLISRAYLRTYGGSRVERIITLGSPHHGTRYAALARGENGAQMRIDNPWLVKINETAVTLPFTSIYSVHDTIISPQDSSAMPEMTGTKNARISGVGHVSMPSGRRTRAHLLAALSKV